MVVEILGRHVYYFTGRVEAGVRPGRWVSQQLIGMMVPFLLVYHSLTVFGQRRCAPPFPLVGFVATSVHSALTWPVDTGPEI